MQVRRQAVGLVEGLAGSSEGVQTLSPAHDELLPALLWLVADSSHISKAALTSLVNLSQVSHDCTRGSKRAARHLSQS